MSEQDHLPKDIIIRHATIEDAAQIARVQVETWRSTYAGIMPDEYLENLSIERAEKGWGNFIEKLPTTRQLMLVAESQSGVVGFASSGDARKQQFGKSAEIFAFYVLESEQGKGIGTEIFRASVRELQTRGHSSLLVWVLAQNPAMRFYQRMGGVEIARENVEVAGTQLEHIGFGWTF